MLSLFVKVAVLGEDFSLEVNIQVNLPEYQLSG